MKRKNRKAISLIQDDQAITDDLFFQNASLIRYNEEVYEKNPLTNIDDIILKSNGEFNAWLNVYGLNFHKQVRKIIKGNKIDEFLFNLTAENNHRNKVIQLTDSIFFTLKSIFFKKNGEDIYFEQLIFIVGADFVWSIQEVRGDHFDHIRKRLKEKVGQVRFKSIDYLFYLMIEAIVDNYYLAYEKLLLKSHELKDFRHVRPNPDYAANVESTRNQLFQIKKASMALKEALTQLEAREEHNLDPKYVIELTEQIKYMNDDIDFTLQQLESAINLIFNIQSHRLNEVMKTLTIFSVIFIPLTFIAGLYGMNFDYIPWTKGEYSFFGMVGIMLVVVILSVFYIKKNKWLD